MVVVAYLMFKNAWSRDEALEFVRNKRAIVRPHPAFMSLLLDWEEVLNAAGRYRFHLQPTACCLQAVPAVSTGHG